MPFLTLNNIINLECETMWKSEEKNRVVVVHVFSVSVAITNNKHTLRES